MVKSYTPKNLADALEALKSTDEYLPYAGGSDINVQNISGRNLFFIGKLPELKRIYEDEKYIHIGSAVTYSEAVKNPLVPEVFKAAIHKVAGPAVRNVGTYGGNLANGSGKADSALVALVCNAVLHIQSASGERFLEEKYFYRGRKDVFLEKDELITELLIPKSKSLNNYYYDKVSVRTSVAISNISVAAIWNIEDDIIKELSVGIGSATDVPIRCYDVENALVGKSIYEVDAQREEILSHFVVDLSLPLDRTSIRYRKQVCYNLLNYLLYEEFTPIDLSDD